MNDRWFDSLTLRLGIPSARVKDKQKSIRWTFASYRLSSRVQSSLDSSIGDRVFVLFTIETYTEVDASTRWKRNFTRTWRPERGTPVPDRAKSKAARVAPCRWYMCANSPSSEISASCWPPALREETNHRPLLCHWDRVLTTIALIVPGNWLAHSASWIAISSNPRKRTSKRKAISIKLFTWRKNRSTVRQRVLIGCSLFSRRTSCSSFTCRREDRFERCEKTNHEFLVRFTWMLALGILERDTVRWQWYPASC